MIEEDKKMLECPEMMCEYCCNFDKEHIGIDGTALCKLTMTLAYAEDYGGNCMFYNVPQERIIVPPVKVGDTVYMPWKFDDNKGIAILDVVGISFRNEYGFINTNLLSDCDEYLSRYNYGRFGFSDLGKTVFLTKEEAEAALKESVGKQ